MQEATIGNLLKAVGQQLRQAGLANADNEARWLLAAGLGVDDTLAGVSRAEPAPPAVVAQVTEFARRRAAGMPLQYVLGNVDFRAHRFAVGPGVLIPRPETEQLVDLALRLYSGQGDICDLCTGSGVIALSLACELRPPPAIVGVDLSPTALAYAVRNRAALGCQTVELLLGDLFEPVADERRFGLVTANPPYISPSEYAVLPAEVRDYEPALALLADQQGLAIFRRLASQAVERLLSGGWLISEIGETQGPDAAAWLAHCGYHDVAIHPDHTGRDRFAIGRR